jgi:hypothetical protein
MSEYTPLEPGEVIFADEEIWNKVRLLPTKKGNREMTLRERQNFQYGMAGQFAHDRVFYNAGWQYQTVGQYEPLDRIFKFWQDDKVCRFSKDKETGAMNQSASVTCSRGERAAWAKQVQEGRDIIVNVFDQVTEFGSEFKFLGSYSFKKILEKAQNWSGKSIIRESTFDDTLYFFKSDLTGCRA